jgi:hypothetical protein
MTIAVRHAQVGADPNTYAGETTVASPAPVETLGGAEDLMYSDNVQNRKLRSENAALRCENYVSMSARYRHIQVPNYSRAVSEQNCSSLNLRGSIVPKW